MNCDFCRSLSPATSQPIFISSRTGKFDLPYGPFYVMIANKLPPGAAEEAFHAVWPLASHLTDAGEPEDAVNARHRLAKLRAWRARPDFCHTVDHCEEQESDHLLRDHGGRQAVLVLVPARWAEVAGAIPRARGLRKEVPPQLCTPPAGGTAATTAPWASCSR